MRQDRFTDGLVVGLLLSLAAGLLLVGGGGMLWVKHRSARARAGWVMSPVVSLAHSAPAGTRLTPELLAEKDVPEQFPAASYFPPAAKPTLLGRTLTADFFAGDPLPAWAVGAR